MLPKLILDNEKKLGDFGKIQSGYPVNLCKEEVARTYLNTLKGKNLKFLDVGAGDKKLVYLLGIKKNLEFDESFYKRNLEDFDKRFEYFALDIVSHNQPNYIIGDVCEESFINEQSQYIGIFDVIYSNNVFEHLKKPWIAARNILKLLKPGGICITIAPFSLRYHEVPQDYFRYTHTGLASLFEDPEVNMLVSGYDLLGRRNNWQGNGDANDVVPLDKFGAFRENWFVITVIQRRENA